MIKPICSNAVKMLLVSFISTLWAPPLYSQELSEQNINLGGITSGYNFSVGTFSFVQSKDEEEQNAQNEASGVEWCMDDDWSSRAIFGASLIFTSNWKGQKLPGQNEKAIFTGGPGIPKFTFNVDNHNMMTFNQEGIYTAGVEVQFNIKEGSEVVFKGGASSNKSHSKDVTYNIANKNSALIFTDLSIGENALIKCEDKGTVKFSGSSGASHLEINADNSAVIFEQKGAIESSKIKVQNGGTLQFNESVACKDTSVILETNPKKYPSTLQIAKHASINHLDVDADSEVILVSSKLELGNGSRQDSLISGKLYGNESSSLVKEGSRKLEICGENSFSEFKGTTILKGGTLLFSNDAALHDQSTIIAAEGNEKKKILFADKSSAGSAAIEVSDCILEFTDSSSGDQAKVTLNTGGALVIHQDNSLASLEANPGSVINLHDSSLRIGNGNVNCRCSGELIGKSRSELIKEGCGKLELNGDISEYQGIAVVNDGTLQISNCVANFASIEANGAHIVFKDSCEVNSPKILAKNGSLLQFDDCSSKQGAKVQLSSKSILELTSNIEIDSIETEAGTKISLNDSALTIGRINEDIKLIGHLQGNPNAKLIKVNAGTLDIVGDKSSYMGKTLIKGGNLHFNNSEGEAHLGGHVELSRAAALSGRGIIEKDLTVHEGGIVNLVSDGHQTLPDLHVKGNLKLFEGCQYHLSVCESGQCSLLTVDGTASIDGSMKIDTSEGYALCTSYTVLEAEDIRGSFEEASVTSGNMKVKINYPESREVQIRLEPDLIGGALTSNQKNVAKTVEEIVDPDHSMSTILDVLVDLQTHETPHTLSQISGEQFGNLILANGFSTSRFLRKIYTPVRFISQDQDCDELSYNLCKVWGDFGGGKSFQSGSNGYELDEFSITASFQKSLNGFLTESLSLSNYIPCHWLIGWTAGIALEYSKQHYDMKVSGNMDLHTTQGALYALLTKSSYYFLVDLSCGYTEGNFFRPIAIRHLHRKAHSDLDLFQATFYGELGLNNFSMWEIAIQPYFGLETGSYSLSSIKEKGAGNLNLKVKGHHTFLTSTFLGVHFYRSLDLDCSWGITADLAWRHLFPYSEDLTERFEQFGSSFKICGEKAGHNALEGACSVCKAINDNLMINVELGGEIWTHYSNYNVSAGVFFTW